MGGVTCSAVPLQEVLLAVVVGWVGLALDVVGRALAVVDVPTVSLSLSGKTPPRGTHFCTMWVEPLP